jgi:hypothetical protein
MGQNQSLKLAGMFSLGGTCTDGAEEFTHSDAGCRLVEANQLTSELIQPNCGFQTEGDWDSGLTMGSTEHHGITLTFCNVCTNLNQMAENFAEKNNAISELQTDCSINNIVGCGPKMNAPSCLAGSLSHGFGERHDVVSCFSFNFTDSFFGNGFRVSNSSNGIVVILSDSSQLPMCPNQGALDFQLTLMASKFRPNALEIFAAVTVIQWTERHDSRHEPRFINFPTDPYEADLGEVESSSTNGSTGAITFRMRKMASTEEPTKDNPTHEERLYHIMATPTSEAYDTIWQRADAKPSL